MNHKFFTKSNVRNKEIFLIPADADKFVSRDDLYMLNKKTTYKGIPRYEYERINLFPVEIEVDFTMNARWTAAEKVRMSVPKWCTDGTVELIGLYQRVQGKIKNHKYTSCANGGSLVAMKICKRQAGLRGRIGNLYYDVSDVDVIEFFESRGYETVKESHGQRDRVSFTKSINTEADGNQYLEDVYNFDKQFQRGWKQAYMPPYNCPITGNTNGFNGCLYPKCGCEWTL
jgi:hypothetical protein